MNDFDAGDATSEDIEAIGKAVVEMIEGQQALGRRVESVTVKRGKLDCQRWIVLVDTRYRGGMGGGAIWIPGVSEADRA